MTSSFKSCFEVTTLDPMVAVVTELHRQPGNGDICHGCNSLWIRYTTPATCFKRFVTKGIKTKLDNLHKAQVELQSDWIHVLVDDLLARDKGQLSCDCG